MDLQTDFWVPNSEISAEQVSWLIHGSDRQKKVINKDNTIYYLSSDNLQKPICSAIHISQTMLVNYSIICSTCVYHPVRFSMIQSDSTGHNYTSDLWQCNKCITNTFPSLAWFPISSFSSCKVRHFAINIFPILLCGVKLTAATLSCNSFTFLSFSSTKF